jgi:death-on-curing protein
MEYPELEDYLLAAEAVLGIDARALARATDLGLAESALAAPAAGFGDEEFYVGVATKAAILCSRVVRNHALVDGNKRVGFVLMLDFIARNGAVWTEPAGGQDEIAETIRQLAASELAEPLFAEWVARHVAAPGDNDFARAQGGDQPHDPTKGGDAMAAKKGGSKSSGKYRSARSGRYVTKKYGRSHPATTVKESK